jgi:pullulanase
MRKELSYATITSLAMVMVKTVHRLSHPSITVTDVTTGKPVMTTLVKVLGTQAEFKLGYPLSSLQAHYEVVLQDDDWHSEAVPLRFFGYFNSPEFLQICVPSAEQHFGVSLQSASTQFAVWSPTASAIALNLYATGDGDGLLATHAMILQSAGVWQLIIPQNLEGQYYTYSVTNRGVTHEIIDPYALSAGVNGKRALIVDAETLLATYNQADNFCATPMDKAIIYEAHVRDLSMSPSTSHSVANRGKFLGVAETGTKNSAGQSTGLDHIVELGATHIHLLPVFDFMSVDESMPDEPQFNWGYDPLNYTVPEGSYSTNATDGYVRMHEFRQMVAQIHQQGLGVIMDVVYNHVGSSTDHPFELLVPDYYFRLTAEGLFADGSDCGNETASNHIMFRRYMIESLTQWSKLYHIDGFRFDLMAIHDIATMNEIAKTLRTINPNTILYGEGWHAGDCALPDEQAALKHNVALMNDIAVFNDDLRDGVKGYVFKVAKGGFVNGDVACKEEALFGFLGALVPVGSFVPYAKNSRQTIAYVTAHDNHTLYDKLKATCPKATLDELMRMQIMANAIVLTATGTPFLHAGVELLRTKGGNDNSYNLPDSVNQINYDDKTKALPVFNYYQGLIALRKAHPIFNQGLVKEGCLHAAQIMIPVKGDDSHTIAVHLHDYSGKDSFSDVLLFFNGGDYTPEYTLPAGNWQLVADSTQVKVTGLLYQQATTLVLIPRSINMLALVRS